MESEIPRPYRSLVSEDSHSVVTPKYRLAVFVPVLDSPVLSGDLYFVYWNGVAVPWVIDISQIKDRRSTAQLLTVAKRHPNTSHPRYYNK